MVTGIPPIGLKMAKPVRNSLGPLLLHHGCDQSLAIDVLEGKKSLEPSEKKHDWLGPGIYFWVDSPMRALSWATEKQEKKPEEIKRPSVICAFAYPGHCLNPTDFGALDELLVAYEKARLLVESQGGKLPVNGTPKNGIYLYRPLDCFAIKMVHELREKMDFPHMTVFTAFLLKAKNYFRDQVLMQRVTPKSPFAILSALPATSEFPASPR